MMNPVLPRLVIRRYDHAVCAFLACFRSCGLLIVGGESFQRNAGFFGHILRSVMRFNPSSFRSYQGSLPAGLYVADVSDTAVFWLMHSR